MVRAAHSRQVRGGTEQYHQRSFRRLVGAPGDSGATAALLNAVAEEITVAADEPLLHLRHLRLTAAQAERLRATLDDLVGGAEEAGEDGSRYGVLVALYRQDDSGSPA